MVVVTIDLEELSRRQVRDSTGVAEVTRGASSELELQALIRRAAEGDSDALKFLYARYSSRVYGYLLPLIRDEHETEDVMQLVFLRLLSKIHLYRQGEAPFHAWLLKVARNVALDHLRQRRAYPCENVFDPNAAADDSFPQHSRSLRDAFSALPDDQRSVVVLRHVLGLSPTEIATRLGRTESSIHGLHNRARTTLRAKLTDLDCTPSVAA